LGKESRGGEKRRLPERGNPKNLHKRKGCGTYRFGECQGKGKKEHLKLFGKGGGAFYVRGGASLGVEPCLFKEKNIMYLIRSGGNRDTT